MSDKQVEETVAKLVYEAMRWAVKHAPPDNKEAPTWLEVGTSNAQTEARRIAALIASAPDQRDADIRMLREALIKAEPFVGYGQYVPDINKQVEQALAATAHYERNEG